MKVTFLLADSAQAINGKLYVLGGGWSVAGPGPVPMALAIKLDVPWDQANQVHRVELSLRTADSDAPVSAPLGEQTIELKIVGSLEVGQPPDLPPGTDLDAVLAVNLAPVMLPPGRYVWRLSVDGETRDEWSRPFTVRQELPSPASSETET